jgi:hypothetical protein
MSANHVLRKKRVASKFLLGLALTLSLAGLALARNPNERHIKPAPNAQDPDEIYDEKGNPKADSKLWVLDIKFKPLRSIKVNIPGRGEQICWYLWYQVINKTAAPHTFVPNVELVTQDTRMVYKDEILPTVLDAISALEDPHGVQKIKSSNAITREPIPASRPRALPKPVTGVIIFTDPNEPLPGDSEAVRREKAAKPKLADSNFFSIFIGGLSNGWAETEAVGDASKTIVRRKTLQLKFHRIGDGTLRRDEDIRYTGHEWLYRASSLEIPKDEDKKEKPPMK